jgi:hypothetical protein
MQQPSNVRIAALDETALSWARRGVWAICIGIYLAVFVGGIQGGGAELLTVGRAAAFTLVAALLGRIALGLLEQARLPVAPGPMAIEDGKLGSLADLVASTNVAQHVDDEANAA